MTDFDVPLVRAAVQNAEKVVSLAEIAKRQEEERQNAERHEKYLNYVTLANNRLNKMIPSGVFLKESDWRMGSRDEQVYVQIPGMGRIYAYDERDPNVPQEDGYFPMMVFGYFKDRMGFGGDQFKSWDELSVLIANHRKALINPTSLYRSSR